jgi:hypothetical protein
VIGATQGWERKGVGISLCLLLFYLFFSAVDAKLKRGLYENVVAYLTVQRVVFRRQVCNLMVDFVPEAWNTG